MSKTIEVEQVAPQALAVREAGAVGQALPAEAIKAPVTAAQAKVDAVANLTMSAYAKAATLAVTPEEAAKLAADFPDEAFQPGAGGKEHLIYIEHAHLRDRLSAVFGMGQWAIIPRNRWAEDFTTGRGTAGSRVYVEAMLVIRGCFVSEAIGAMEYYPKNEAQNYGDAVEGAKTAALRRCAKELGVGLQAWKKEWCEGWWTRRRGGNAPGRAGGVSTPNPTPKTAATRQSATNPPPKAQPSAAQPTTPAQKQDTTRYPTDKTRQWMITELQECADLALEYFQKVGPPSQLLPTEGLADLPLRFVPINRGQMAALKDAIAAFGNGEDACPAFPPNAEAPGEAPAKSAGEVAGAVTASPAAAQAAAKSPTDDEWWRDIIVPVPHKGEPRAEYMKHPDTIGSLFDARHGTDDLAAEARQRLFGFVNHYEPKGWEKRDGTKMPASAADLKFREALDAFADWFEKHHEGEKL
jgi:hypothetical protein